MKYFFASLFLFFCIIFCVWFYYLLNYPKTPIQTTIFYLLEHLIHPRVSLTKELDGFLPYWQIEEIQTLRLNILSEVTYFGLTINADGSLKKQTGNETEPGWREWQTQKMDNFITKAHINGSKISLTIINHDNEIIKSFLDNQNAQQTLITELISQIKEKNLNGINIDFEYLGKPELLYQKKFTAFSKRLSQQLKKQSPRLQLTLSTMPLAARGQDLFNFKELLPFYNRFLIMSYDYYGATSDISAPGAPMKGVLEGKYFFDITTTYEDYIKLIPKEKILMGVPYYGWDRTVQDGKILNSRTFNPNDPNNYAAILSYARMKQEKIKENNNCLWDYYAQATWCWYTDKKTHLDHQVWIEDEKSLSNKYDFVNKQQFAGIAIWALGYDKTYPELWKLLQTKFKK
jgi:spore germination protein YaaH